MIGVDFGYMPAKFTFRELKKFKRENLKDLNNLLLQWSNKGYQMSPRYFKKLIKKSHILVLFNKNRIVGTVTLVELSKLSGAKGSIEHLILDKKYRGRGLGKSLMNFAVNSAKKLKIKTLFLTCEPERKVANNLYKKLGFKIKKTNFYFKNLI